MDAIVDEPLVQRLVVDGDRAGVAERAEILRWKKREAAERAERPRAAAVQLRADGLRGVFDDRQAMLLRDGVDLVHRRGLSVEMHRHDGLRGGGDAGLDEGGIDVVVVEADVDEHRRRAEPVYDSRGGEERERGDDDFVLRSDAEDHESDEEGVGAGGDPDGVLGVAVGGEVALEIIDSLPQDELLRRIHLLGHPQHVIANGGVLLFEIE